MGEQLLKIVSVLKTKIKEAKKEIRQERWENGKFKAKKTIREHWNQFKDFILVIYLLNTLIGVARQIEIFEPRVIVIENAQASTTKPTIKEQSDEKKDSIDINQIVAKVYRLESSAGQNDSCHKSGLHNDYGYGQRAGKQNCYNTTQEVQQLVTSWFKEKLNAGYSVEEALCMYNVGIKESSCDYVNKYNQL